MASQLEPDTLDSSAAACDLPSGASLIQVAASEQLAPGALYHCPVCARPYGPEHLLAVYRQAAMTPDERMVFLCARCGAYSVGMLPASPEA
jgi:hypothetical protein